MIREKVISLIKFKKRRNSCEVERIQGFFTGTSLRPKEVFIEENGLIERGGQKLRMIVLRIYAKDLQREEEPLP